MIEMEEFAMSVLFNSTLLEKESEYIEAFDFEVYDLPNTIFLLGKFRPFMFTIVSLYLLGIHFGQKWMKDRPAYDLRSALFLWNVGLSIFSIVATIRGFPETSFLLSQPNGAYLALCSWQTHNYATSYWILMFMLSKIVELGDTAFIVLRKQKLIVLHWFHHLSTLLGCWVAFEYYDAASRFFFVNTFVHSIMYPYYALKVLKVKIPKQLSMALTTIQILQMFYMVYQLLYIIYLKGQGLPCQVHTHSLYLGGTIGPIFLMLFLNFFIRTYVTGEKVKGI